MELTVSELRNRLLDVIRRVESGEEEVLVTRHGKRVARIAPVGRSPRDVLDVDRDRLRIADADDPLLSTDEVWDLG
jgi:prevent-host-death family protein